MPNPNQAAQAPSALKFRRTRIIATLGPASSDPTTIAALIEAGVDVFRLNMSHGDHAGHRRTYAAVRAAAARLDAHVAVLGDLSGPKIRVGRFPGGGIELETGATVVVTVRDVEGAPGLIPSQYAELASDVVLGDRILLDDGNLELRVEGVDGTEIRCHIVAGGRLSDRKGMNLPGVAVSAPALTPKDRVDAAFAVELGVDLLALSFVRTAADIEALRALVGPLVAQAEDAPALIAKIEKPEALENIDAILDAVDGIMVARGDLGVELPPERVPMAQEMLVARARAHRRPVIVATQMLESMIERPRPTRAEVSDVAGAVRSGADAVMLSGETAMGAFPVAAVRMMDAIAREAEAWQWSHGAFGDLTGEDEGSRPMPVNAAVSLATARLSRDLEVRAIIALSRSGRTTAIMSAARPAAPLVAASPSLHLRRVSRLLWGTRPAPIAPEDFDDAPAFARRIAVELGFAEPGQCILLVRGFSDDPAQNMPSITTLRV